MEFPPETELTAKAQVSVSTTCERELGVTRPETAEKPSKTVSKQTDIRASYQASQKINPHPHLHTTESPSPHFHTIMPAMLMTISMETKQYAITQKKA